MNQRVRIAQVNDRLIEPRDGETHQEPVERNGAPVTPSRTVATVPPAPQARFRAPEFRVTADGGRQHSPSPLRTFDAALAASLPRPGWPGRFHQQTDAGRAQGRALPIGRMFGEAVNTQHRRVRCPGDRCGLSLCTSIAQVCRSMPGSLRTWSGTAAQHKLKRPRPQFPPVREAAASTTASLVAKR